MRLTPKYLTPVPDLRLGLEEIVKRIDQEAAERASKIVGEATEGATKVMAESKERAESILAGAKAQAEREAREERQRSVASARLAAKRELLQAREDVLKRYEAGVLASVDSFAKSDEYLKFLTRAIEQGVSKIGKDAEIRVNSRDKAALKGKKLGGELSKETLDSKGGALVVSADGKRRVDNTVESLLRERSDALRLMLTQQVFGDQTKSGS